MKDVMGHIIKDFMQKDVVSVKKDENLKKVFKLMDKHGILGLPVVSDDDGVIGIVTESDLLSHFTTLETPLSVNLLGSVVYLENMSEFNESLKDHCAESVEDVMTNEVFTVIETQTLKDAIELMSKKGVSRLPVVDVEGKLSGIVTRKDIVHQLAKLTII